MIGSMQTRVNNKISCLCYRKALIFKTLLHLLNIAIILQCMTSFLVVFLIFKEGIQVLWSGHNDQWSINDPSKSIHVIINKILGNFFSFYFHYSKSLFDEGGNEHYFLHCCMLAI